MVTISVNEAIEHLDGLAGKDISVRGMLSFEFENISLAHVPRLERAPDHASSIWLAVGNGSLGFDPAVCERLRGKVVIVEGTLFKPDPRFGGCGHFSLWPAEIRARTLALAPTHGQA